MQFARASHPAATKRGLGRASLGTLSVFFRMAMILVNSRVADYFGVDESERSMRLVGAGMSADAVAGCLALGAGRLALVGNRLGIRVGRGRHHLRVLCAAVKNKTLAPVRRPKPATRGCRMKFASKATAGKARGAPAPEFPPRRGHASKVWVAWQGKSILEIRVRGALGGGRGIPAEPCPGELKGMQQLRAICAAATERGTFLGALQGSGGLL